MTRLFGWCLPLGVAVAANLALWAWLGQPVVLPPAPEAKLHCASYTPFRGDQTPFDRSLVIPAAQIEADLRKLQPITDCVRTYAVDQGLDQVVPIAETLGMKVLLGIWIGWERGPNERQIATAIELAKAHPGAIKAIVVGNEVLLRGEQTGEALAEMLMRVKRATGLPVTYADVWEYWNRAPQALKDAADIITIHILPYWEDDPIPASRSVAHVAAIVGMMRELYPGRPIMIGETGWPSAGRAREDAVPSIVNQARYLREFLVFAKSQDLDYNFIEAFDQPWKRWQEGAVGGYWGLFTENRAAKFDWFQPVSDWPDWRRQCAIATAIGGLLLLMGVGASRSAAPATSLSRRMILALGALLTGGVLCLAWAHGALAVRNDWEWALEIGLMLQTALTAVLLMRAAAGDRADAAPADIRAGLDWLVAPWRRPDSAVLLGLLRGAAMVGAATASLGLCFDPRYRDFPLAAFAVPAIGFFLFLWWRGAIRKPRVDAVEEAMLSAILLATAIFIAINEGPLNLQAMGWCGLTLLLAAPGCGTLLALWRQRRARASSVSSNPTAANPAL